MTCLDCHSEVTQYPKNLRLYSVDGEDSYSTSLKDYGLHCVQGGVHKRRMNLHLYSIGGRLLTDFAQGPWPSLLSG